MSSRTPLRPRRRPALLATVAASALLAPVLAGPALAAVPTPSAATSPEVAAAAPFLVGVGKADMTGEPGENGMMGYGDGAQKTSGIHMRQWARAFVVADPTTGERVLVLGGDMLTGTNLVRERVLEALRARFGDAYTDANVMIAGTHTHATPGGTTDYSLYNVTTLGVHEKTLDATVDGLVRAVEEAEATLAPGSLGLGSATLTDASVNRSRGAWERNPPWLQDALPDAKDPASRTLTVRAGGETIGAVNWFGTHPTSLPTENTLISGDNKGYAEHRWEEELGGVAFFASSNGADQTANLNLRPGSGPTEDPFRNLELLGERQYRAARAGAETASPVTAQPGADGSRVDSAMLWLDMQNQQVAAEFTTTGRPQATCRAVLGAPFGAGSTEDGGGGATFLEEGVGNNPFLALLTRGEHLRDPGLRDCQAPKATLLESGALDGVQTTLPVQLFRLGDVWIAGMPGEVTAASGVLVRRTVADAVGTVPDRVLVTSNANAYGHYFTTPWEYDQQDYEGGATIFGRYTTPALLQGLATAASNITTGGPEVVGRAPSLRPYVRSAVGVVWHDVPGTRAYGDVLDQPAEAVAPGETVSARFQGAHPNNDLRHEGTYLEVQRQRADGTWERVADDDDPATRFRWERVLAAQSHVTISWEVAQDAAPGTYRLVYHGTWKEAVMGRLTDFTGESRTFRVG